MRMMMKVSIPTEPGNKAIRDGTLPKTVAGFVEQVKPEALYFTAQGGERTAFLFFDLKDPTRDPVDRRAVLHEPRSVDEFAPAMNLEEMKSGVEKAMKRG